MDLRQLWSSLIIILTLQPPSSYTASNNSQPLFANETSPASVTWIRITTLDPKSRDGRCKSCTTFDYDDPYDRHADTSPRRRRKRRRNKKPTSDRQSSWTNRRASGEHSRKKYSTRVHLDKPAKFAAALVEAFSSTAAPRPTAPAPVRYLLPPFVTSDLKQQMATSEWTTGRGSTKFKDTLHDRENELDSSAPSPPPAFIYPTSKATKSRLRPIVVLDLIVNSTSELANGGSLVSPEVAKAGIGMKAIDEQTSAYGGQHFIHQNEQPRAEHTTRMTAFWPASESQPIDISENYILEQSSRFQESSSPPSKPTAGVFDNNLAYQPTERFVSGQIREFVPSSTTTFRNEYFRQSDRYPENYSSTSATRRTAATVAYNATSYSPPLHNSDEDDLKGLQLAESSYFSDLPSQREVMKLTQTGNYFVPLIR
ncbi:hypothetical protein V9T40_006855 [Parthenolecanium corni]|uniref:Uncharacterized protein n=1 Tax=Parthenolecanium corni TaxID=536013 RepID=A0AAN9TU02_9HEMI